VNYFSWQYNLILRNFKKARQDISNKNQGKDKGTPNRER